MMTAMEPDQRFANTKSILVESDVFDTSRMRLPKALDQAEKLLSDRGIEDDLAKGFGADLLSAETALWDENFSLCRSLLSRSFEGFDEHEPTLEGKNRIRRKTEASAGGAMTLFGPVDYHRSRYNLSNNREKPVVPVEDRLGLNESDMPPAASGLSMALMSGQKDRECEDVLVRFCGKKPSISVLTRLPAEAGRCPEERSPETINESRTRDELPESAAVVHSSIDGKSA